MDFLLDVNASGAIARWLLERGHNVAAREVTLWCLTFGEPPTI